MKNEIYVIKLWSNVLLDHWGVDKHVIENVVYGVNYLKSINIKVIIVSSWAVALWMKKLWKRIINPLNFIESEQIFSSIWQTSLMNIYSEYFNKYSIEVSQALLTRKDFLDGDRYESMKNVLVSSLWEKIIPIINENDVLSQEELNFSDNDELSALVAKMVWASKLIILSNIDWLLDNFPNWNIIWEVNNIDKNILSMVWNEKSSHWKWWMNSKLIIANDMMNLWIKMYLANGKKKWIIEKIANWENVGTLFIKN